MTSIHAIIATMTLDSQIEAILYFRAEPVSFKELGTLVGKPENAVREAIQALKERLHNGGLSVIEESDSAELRTSPDATELIQKMIRDEDNKELTKSALETLSIVLYKGPIKRRDIDFIRGVNSSFILRTLSGRGLIKKSSANGRENIYESSTELLSHLGISSQKDLPEYESTKEVLEEKVADLISKHDD